MAEIKDVVKVVLEQLDKKKEELKAELLEQRDLHQALAALESKAQDLKQQVEVLANLPVPKDLLDFYVKSGGRIWVSKLRGFVASDDFRIQHRARTLNYPEVGHSTTFEGLPSGAYRFVLLAIPQDIPKNFDKRWGPDEWQDEYGETFRIKPDC